MATSSPLESISESETLSTSSGDEFCTSDDELIKNPDNCMALIQMFLDTGFLSMQRDRIAAAMKVLQRNGTLDSKTKEQVSLRFLTICIGNKDYAAAIDEISSVNIYEKKFFMRLWHIKRVPPHWKYQIVEAISVRFENDEMISSRVQVLCETCFQFIQFIRQILPYSGTDKNPIIINAAKRIVISLFKGYSSERTEMVVHDKENRLVEVLKFIKSCLQETNDTSILHQLWFLEAVQKIEKHNRKQANVEESVAILNRILKTSSDESLKRFCLELRQEGVDLITILNMRLAEEQQNHVDPPPAPVEARPSRKKKKKKNNRSLSAEPPPRDAALVNEAPARRGSVDGSSDSDIDTLETSSQATGSQAVVVDVGISSDDTSKLLQFIEKFPMYTCRDGYIAEHVNSRNLCMIPSTERTITHALWSTMSAAARSRGDWHLNNASFDDFHAQLRALLKDVHPDIIKDHRILQYVANRYLVQIEVITGLYPLVPDVAVKPKKPHKSTIHILHVTGKEYIGLSDYESRSKESKVHIDAARPFVPDEGSNCQDQVTSSTNLSGQMSELLKSLSWLRERQTVDDFISNCTVDERMKPSYDLVTKDRLIALLKEEPNSYKKCTLYLQGPHEGYAIPCSETVNERTRRRDPRQRERILLRGRRNCGMAFEGDIVVVRVFRTTRGVVTGGRVVGVLETTIRAVYQLFFCKVCSDQTTLMKPICGTLPKIHVANERAEEEYVEKCLPDAMRVYEFGMERGSHTETHKERADKKFANKCMVTIYSVSPKEKKGVDFKFKKVKKIQRLTCEEIFVVVYKKWDQYHLYPYGYVVAALQPSRSMADELAMMRLQCQLPHYYKEEKKALSEAKAISRKADDPRMLENRRDFRKVTTFTIDNDDTRDMDDAISIQMAGDVLEVGIHITDVSQYVMHDGDLDRAARERAITVYGVPNKTQPVHMLPETLSKNKLSLVQGQDRLCLSVIIKFEVDTCKMMTDTQDGEEIIFKSIINSNHKLTKKQVTSILRSSEENVESRENPAANTIPRMTIDLLRKLSDCAWKMRKERYKEAIYYHDDSLADLSEIGATFEAEVLVEELMVEANFRVARFLSRKFPNLSLQRLHPPPDSADVEDWLWKHQTDARHSGHLKRYLELMKIEGNRVQGDHPLFFSSEVVQKIKAAVDKKDFDTPFHLLSAERLHPSLLLAIGDFHAIMKPAQYGRDNSKVCVKHNGSSHFGLNAAEYVHFTSPLRRYSDLVVHRLVHAALESRKPPFTEYEIDQIAQTCSEMQRRAKPYEKSLLLYQLHLKAQENPLSLPCVISDITSPSVTLDHRMISKLPLSARSFTHAQLVLAKKPENPTKSSLRCHWRERIFIVDHDERTRHPNPRQPVSERREMIVQSFEKQYYMERFGRICNSPLYSILRQYGTLSWATLFRNCPFKPVEVRNDDKVLDVTSEMIPMTEAVESVGQNASAKSRRIVLNPAVTFSMDLTVKKALRAQFTAPAVRSARMRTPKLQYLQLCRSFGICIEHRDNPVLCFGGAVGEPIDEHREFSDVSDYQELWLPVLQMESITESMMDENSYHLRGVEIFWMYDGKNFGGIFCLEDKFCADPFRQIRINSEGNLFDCADSGGYTDFLCVRYELDDKCWIGHGGVKYTTTVNNKTVIYFVIHQHANPVPMEIMKEGKLATVEFIVKTMPKRRQEKAVELLSNVPDSTAVKIAVGEFNAGQGLSQQQEYIDTMYDVMFKNIHLHTARCNRYQQKAIENSFTWPISLIWGPPGTGKTITGIQITFWYCEFNKRLNSMPVKDEQSEAADTCAEAPLSDEEEEVPEENPRKNYPNVWEGYEEVRSRRRRRRSSNSTSTTGDSGIVQDSDNQLLKWIDFPPPGDIPQISSIPLKSRRRQVLYCGPSNDCVNCVAEHLRTKVDNGYISLVRIFSELVELSEFPVPGEDASFSRLNSQVQVPENLLEICLHRLVRSEDKPYAKILRKFDAAFKKVFIYLEGKSPDIPRATVGQHSDLLHKLRKAAREYHGILRAAKSLELRFHDVVLCTSAVSASMLVQENCRFSQVIIDEAGMCTEAETLVPLVPLNENNSASAGIENVVLIGDHKQLRPILRNNVAAELGLERSMLQRHWMAGIRKKQQNRTMLEIQYRMHPSICEFPSVNIYNGRLKTGVSPLWSGLGDDDVQYRHEWTGLNPEIAAKFFYKSVLENANANILRGHWPGTNRKGFRCMPHAEVNRRYGEEERVVFLHVEGEEESLTLTTEEGNENSKSNKREVDEVIRVYLELRKRFTQPRTALNSIAVLSQYQHQVHEIAKGLKEKLKAPTDHGICNKFRRVVDKFREDPSPIVSSVVRSQGSEFDYVIFSTVRSLPEHDIDPKPTPGWEKKYLGFITDRNQVNVAITRARKGLVIIGNGNLLRVHGFWNDLLTNLRNRNCYVSNPRDFPFKRNGQYT